MMHFPGVLIHGPNWFGKLRFRINDAADAVGRRVYVGAVRNLQGVKQLRQIVTVNVEERLLAA
jgi:hypothetical protein